MGKKDSKHGHKKKSSHKKKHKKEKKKHKHKEKKSMHHKSSDSSESDVSTDSSSWESDKESQKAAIGKGRDFNDESDWDALFSDRNAKVREKNVPNKNRHILDRPGQSTRELNPYWKDGGDGLPPNIDEILSNCDVRSLKKLLQTAKDTAEMTGEPLEKIIEEEWGPIEKLKQIIEDAENPRIHEENRRRAFHRPSSPSDQRGGSGTYDQSERRLNFMKPGEITNTDFTNTYSRNWRKKQAVHPTDESVPSQSSTKDETKDVDASANKPLLTADELNALAAKAMKAEIMGNTELAKKLRQEIEDAKKNREGSASARGSGTEKKMEEVVLLTRTNVTGMTKPCDGSEYAPSQGSRKKQKVETHRGNERVRYFVDDDKYSLKSMFEKEKFSSADQSNELFLKMAKKGKIRSNNDDDDMDDDFLDRVRGSDYERKERERERSRAMNEAKSKHKSLSNCRWCLDGNNVQKHLIVSVGTKCYLCLPCDESLTTGHCLIVPVHHDTCGTMLDEDVWNEMQMYRKSLCRMFEEAGQDVVFFENARSFHRHPHMVLNCVPMDKEIGDLAPIYFKKAILESETEWSNNKKLVDLREKDLRRSVPKGLPYFAVDFGRDGGFAHVIEDEKLFPPNFAEEIIGGMLDLDASKWRKHRKESIEVQKEKVADFLKEWKKFESKKRQRQKSDSSDSD